jgi:hypothetical protein
MAAGESAMLRGPIERSVRIDTSRREASVGVLPLAGLYSLESGGASRAVGVNLFDSGETAARITTVEDGQTASARGGIAADAGETQRRELWPWLLLAVVALLTAEWLVYAWQMRGS